MSDLSAFQEKVDLIDENLTSLFARVASLEDDLRPRMANLETTVGSLTAKIADLITGV